MHPNPEVRKLQAFIDDLLASRSELRVLEAGCGSYRHITFNQRAHIVGIDLSEDQLSRNDSLNEKIVGDIQDYPLLDSSYDVIVCWNTLEHVPRPEAALRNFIRAVREDGIIIIAVPNALSIKGLVTKFTPYSFHIWFHKHVYKNAMAGVPGFDPFPTFMRLTMVKLAANYGLVVEYYRCYESAGQKQLREKLKIVHKRWEILRRAIAVLTLGAVSADQTECHLVLRKPPAQVRQPTDPGVQSGGMPGE